MVTIRKTIHVLRVLRIYRDHPESKFSGREIGRLANLASGTVYPIMLRLEGRGVLKSEWENVDPHVEKRPRRRFYSITDDGLGLISDLADEIEGV